MGKIPEESEKLYHTIREINTEIKVILSSGYSIDGPAQAILDEGVLAFLQKPFELEKLKKEVARILAQQ